MKAEYVNPFISECLDIFKEVASIQLNWIKEKTFVKKPTTPNETVAINLGIVGDIRGNIALQLNMETAKSIVSSMMGGMTIKEMDEIGRSAIAELGNMIAGRASILIAEKGYSVDITPPQVLLHSPTPYLTDDKRPTLACIFTAEDKNVQLEISLKETGAL